MNLFFSILYMLGDLLFMWAAATPDAPKNKFWGAVHKWTIRCLLVAATVSVIYFLYLWITV